VEGGPRGVRAEMNGAMRDVMEKMLCVMRLRERAWRGNAPAGASLKGVKKERWERAA